MTQKLFLILLLFSTSFYSHAATFDVNGNTVNMTTPNGLTPFSDIIVQNNGTLTFEPSSQGIFSGFFQTGNKTITVDNAQVNYNTSGVFGGENAANTMFITNGGDFNITGQFGIGYNAANQNSVTVSGPGSSINSLTSSHFFVGQGHADQSSLVISNGAVFSMVGDSALIVGSEGMDNSLILTGAGSAMTNRVIIVGDGVVNDSIYAVNNNSVTILDGANALTSRIAIGQFNTASNNSLIIRGAGSSLQAMISSVAPPHEADGTVAVGPNGYNGSMIVDQGGQFTSEVSLSVGGGSSAVSNSLIIDGPGSTANTWVFDLGTGGNSNTTTVSNGGKLNTEYVFIGYDNGISNTLTMSGADSQVIAANSAGTGYVSVVTGDFIQNGGTLITDKLKVEPNPTAFLLNQPALYQINGGTAIVGQVNINNMTLATPAPSFNVGNGVDATLFKQTLAGEGNTFAGGVVINNNAIFSLAGVMNDDIFINGGTLSGNGTFNGTITSGGGGVISPGNSPGIISFANFFFVGGDKYDWEINNFSGTQGLNWDLINVSGNLNIVATALNPFKIKPITLDSFNALGLTSDWDSSIDHSWVIAMANAINGFDPAKFKIDTIGFENSFNGSGTFSVSSTGQQILLNYTAVAAVPEPGTWGLLSLGLVISILSILYHRRRRVRVEDLRILPS